nr:immunoglobulin heavy chain junction region [Macaca mulatta]
CARSEVVAPRYW